MLKRFLRLPRRQKQTVSICIDFVLLIAAFWSALGLRFETLRPDLTAYGWQMVAAPVFAIPIFARLGLYRAVVRFMEDRVVFVVAGGVTLSVLLLAALVALTHSPGLSRGVLAIYWLLAIVYVGATRFLARTWFLHAERQHAGRKRVAIYGAGSAGTQLAYALRAGKEYWPVLFFDDDLARQKVEVAGLRVRAPSELERLIDKLRIEELLLAIPSATRARRLEIIDRLEHVQCSVKLVPGMADVVSGNIAVDAIREVEIEDLLGRESVAPDERLLGKCVTGKVVMVSGAGGSIGSELCRQIVRLRPVRLVLLDLSEFGLYSIHQELSETCARMNLEVELVPMLGTVMHQRRTEIVMRSFGVHSVYHAAAYKHVPIVEHNPVEGIRNNAIGTLRMAEAALAAGVETFVLVSTDKAVRPTNVMGASKRLAELILQALTRPEGRTRFCMVRFGNVLGSSGSVVPLFRKQISAGGPITLTHPEITRYFMTIPEAAQLVIQAGSMSKGGEVYVLDMGQPVKIIDLARRMIHLSGREVRDEQHPDGDIAIETIGLRPGEKLYEELLIGDNVEGTSHPLIMRAYEHEVPWSVLSERLAQLDEACQAFDFEKVLELLALLVQEYKPVRHGDEALVWRALVTSGRSGIAMVP
ncbi:nucleoside-diphosphate sugar epimerase/dehydratase [Accumulibacter sp.]|uniref:polysaccharide biosynthesis protein n=1 Tax=Accumulibacter sp. TaxID=2053492 RepID=UPI0025ED96D6|nr:nucleoside-diphosphate sugar epimerase/dehydratase [Accumulibacter sp.]MCM8594248.1 polysaccharide biosynthesis protein [Accumulibacter sp.]MCM8625814.1 polysaccharide biosynthesis protein [Accumulibacter sp.]MDS4048392.1 nucleoside-diphosphate sugar epimerase/dehydratase [Accumulibacter sp.]